MKKTFFHTLLWGLSILAGFPLPCGAQIWQGDIFLRSQADVDSFLVKYGPVEHITGTLHIGSTNALWPTDIVDVTALSSLKSIGVRFYVMNNCCLETLDGLQNLDSVGSWTEMWGNTQLRNLDDLQHFRTSGMGLGIYQNPNLENLDGLRQVLNRDTPSYIRISENPKLRSFDLSRLRRAVILEIWECGLDNLDGLDSLETVDYLYIGYLPHLKSLGNSLRRLRDAVALGFVQLDSLPSLEGISAEVPETYTLEDKIWVLRCNMLHDLRGFEKIDTVTEDLVIIGNDSLQSLTGLSNLVQTGFTSPSYMPLGAYDYNYTAHPILHSGNFYIADNPSLTFLDLPRLKHAYLAIDRNQSLQTLIGMDSLQHGTVGCSYNTKLRDIGSFEHLEKAGDLIFFHNHLDSITGFNHLKDFRNYRITDTALQVWKGLEAVDSTRGNIAYSTFDYTIPWTLKLKEVLLMNNARHGGAIGMDVFPGADVPDVPSFTTSIKYGTQSLTHREVQISYWLRQQGSILPICDSLLDFNEYGQPKLSTVHLYTPNTVNADYTLARLRYSYNVYLSWLHQYPYFNAALERAGLLSISYCDSNVMFFPNLQKLETIYPNTTTFSIYGHQTRQLTGFGQLQTFTGGLSLSNNDSLTDCRALCHLLSLPPTNRPVSITNTPFPCDTKTNILAWCDTLNTATDQMLEPLGLSLSPNPAADEAWVEADGLRRLVLFNAAGVPLLERFFPDGLFSSYRLPLSDLPAGAYWVVAYADGRRGVKMLQVVR